MTKYRIIAQRWGVCEYPHVIASYKWKWLARIHSILCQLDPMYSMAFIIEDKLADPL